MYVTAASSDVSDHRRLVDVGSDPTQPFLEILLLFYLGRPGCGTDRGTISGHTKNLRPQKIEGTGVQGTFRGEFLKTGAF